MFVSRDASQIEPNAGLTIPPGAKTKDVASTLGQLNLREMEERAQTVRQDIKRLELAIEDSEQKLIKLRAKYQSRGQHPSNDASYGPLNEQKRSLVKQLETLRAEKDQLQKTIVTRNDEVDQLGRQVKRLEERLADDGGHHYHEIGKARLAVRNALQSLEAAEQAREADGAELARLRPRLDQARGFEISER